MSKKDMILMGLEACEKGACDMCPYMEEARCQKQLVKDAHMAIEEKLEDKPEKRYTAMEIADATGYELSTIYYFMADSGVKYNPLGHTMEEVWKIVGYSRVPTTARMNEKRDVNANALELNILLQLFAEGHNGGAAANRYQSAG